MTGNCEESRRGLSPLKVVPLRKDHLTDAAELFAAAYRALRRQVHPMPPRHEDPGSILPKLQELAAKTSGVVAIRKREVVGFMMGQTLSSFRGKRTIYCPEWAHAAEPHGRRDIYRAMYAHIARRWAEDGCLVHLITAFADQQEALDAFFWLGFGMIGVDAVRDMTPLGARVADVEIRQAKTGDIEVVLTLMHGLEEHISSSPVYKFYAEKSSREAIQKRLDEPAHTIWLASVNGAVVACVDVESPKSVALYTIEEETTANITKTFTKEGYRNRGIAAALLNRVLDWARSRDYERCAVGFEPQNTPGSRFWLKHFQPVCYSMIRHIDERIAGTRCPDSGPWQE